MNRVTFYRAKYLDVVTLKILPTSRFLYNSKKHNLKILKKLKIPESENEEKQK